MKHSWNKDYRNLRKIVVSVAVAIVICTSTSGCSKQLERSDGKVRGVDASPDAPSPPAEYIYSFKKTELGEAEIHSLRPESYGSRRAAIEKRSVHRMFFRSPLNREIFTLDGEILPRTLIATPSIIFKNIVERSNQTPREKASGDLAVDMSVVFADGLKSTISPESGGNYLSARSMASGLGPLVEEVTQADGQKPEFLSEVVCPKSFLITIEGQDAFRAEFESRLKYCPFNASFPGSIVLSKGAWNKLVSAFSSGRRVTAETSFDLTLPIVIQQLDFTLRFSQVASVVSQSLSSMKSPYSSADIGRVLDALVSEIERSFEVSFNREEASVFLSEVLRREFFELPLSQCIDTQALCYGRHTGSDGAHPYVFTVRHDELVTSKLSIGIEAPLTAEMSDSQRFLIRGGSENLLAPPQESEVSPLFRTVGAGDIVEFNIKYFQLSKFEMIQPKTETTQSLVCGDPYALCTNGEWKCAAKPEHIAMYNGVSPCLLFPPPAWPAIKTPYRIGKRVLALHYEWVCTEFDPKHCDPGKMENHWSATETFSFPALTDHFESQPWKAEYFEKILPGIRLRFSSQSNLGGEVTECPLSDFEYEVRGNDSLLITLRNGSGCTPFNALNRIAGYQPLISFVSRISLPQEFRCGTRTQSWDGKVLYRCRLPDGSEEEIATTSAEEEDRIARREPSGIHRLYYPQVQLQGSFRIIGSTSLASLNSSNLASEVGK